MEYVIFSYNPCVSVFQEQERVEQGVTQQQKVQEAGRQKLLGKVRQAEASISTRISTLLLDNKRCENKWSVRSGGKISEQFSVATSEK